MRVYSRSQHAALCRALKRQAKSVQEKKQKAVELLGGKRGFLMECAGLQIEQSVFGVLAGAKCCVLGQDTYYFLKLPSRFSHLFKGLFL